MAFSLLDMGDMKITVNGDSSAETEELANEIEDIIKQANGMTLDHI